MIKHISKLQISDDHSDYETDEDSAIDDNDFGGETSFEPGKLSDLSNIKKITIVEQFKNRLRNDDDFFFAKLFNKHNKSNACRSLVVWKPPSISVDTLLLTPATTADADEKLSCEETTPKMVESSLPTMDIDWFAAEIKIYLLKDEIVLIFTHFHFSCQKFKNESCDSVEVGTPCEMWTVYFSCVQEQSFGDWLTVEIVNSWSAERPFKIRENSNLQIEKTARNTMSERENNVYKAKLAEQAERYDGKRWNQMWNFAMAVYNFFFRRRSIFSMELQWRTSEIWKWKNEWK